MFTLYIEPKHNNNGLFKSLPVVHFTTCGGKNYQRHQLFNTRWQIVLEMFIDVNIDIILLVLLDLF